MLVESGAADDEKRMESLRETLVLSAITSAGAEGRSNRRSAAVLDHDQESEKILSATDVRYKICLLGSAFHIGFDRPVQVEYDGHVYSAKMHKLAKGRVDRLSALYKEYDLKEGDHLLVRYEHDRNRLILRKP